MPKVTQTPDSQPETTMRSKIIVAAEDLFRRHGPAKTNVVDVARHLGMSHANVYRHFASKAAIQDAVAAGWLERMIAPLDQIVRSRASAEDRIFRWVERLIEIKETAIQDDPELFATYNKLAEASRGVIAEHVEHLRAQLQIIVEDGIKNGEFKVKDAKAVARAIHESTTRYQHPFFVSRPEKHSDGMHLLLTLLIAGMKADVA